MSRAARAFALVLAVVWPLAGPADASPSSKSGEGPPAAFSRAAAAGAGGRFTLEVQVERAGRREIPLHALSVELNGDRVLRLEDLSSATGGALRGVALERKNELRVALYASRPTSVTVTVHDNSTHPPTAVFGPEPFEHRPAARLGWRRIPFASARAVARSVSFPAPPMPPPNIVLIIGDDHAWTHSGFMGHELALTPALDSLAEGGTTFTNAQLSASTCRPSLQTLLSGLRKLPRPDDRPIRTISKDVIPAHRVCNARQRGDARVDGVVEALALVHIAGLSAGRTSDGVLCEALRPACDDGSIKAAVWAEQAGETGQGTTWSLA